MWHITNNTHVRILKYPSSIFWIYSFGRLAHFMPLVSSYTPWKHQRTSGIFMFSGSMERDHWHEMGWTVLRVVVKSNEFQTQKQKTVQNILNWYDKITLSGCVTFNWNKCFVFVKYKPVSFDITVALPNFRILLMLISVILFLWMHLYQWP